MTWPPGASSRRCGQRHRRANAAIWSVSSPRLRGCGTAPGSGARPSPAYARSDSASASGVPCRVRRPTCPRRLADVQRLGDGADHERARRCPASSRSRRSLAICAGSRSRGSPCGSQPSPRTRGPAHGGGRGAAHPDGRPRLLRGPRPLPEPLEREPLPVRTPGTPPARAPPSARRSSRRARPRAASKSAPSASNSSCTCPAPTPRISRPPERWSRVAYCLAVTSGCRSPTTATWLSSRTRSVIAREVGEGGDRVVPDGAHRLGEPPRDRDVVAARHVGEAGAGRRRGRSRRDRRARPRPPRLPHRWCSATGPGAASRTQPPGGQYRHRVASLPPCPPRPDLTYRHFEAGAIVVPDGASDKREGSTAAPSPGRSPDSRVRRLEPAPPPAGRSHPA